MNLRHLCLATLQLLVIVFVIRLAYIYGPRCPCHCLWCTHTHIANGAPCFWLFLSNCPFHLLGTPCITFDHSCQTAPAICLVSPCNAFGHSRPTMHKDMPRSCIHWSGLWLSLSSHAERYGFSVAGIVLPRLTRPLSTTPCSIAWPSCLTRAARLVGAKTEQKEGQIGGIRCYYTTKGSVPQTTRVGQNHIYTVCMRYFWQGNRQIYGHIRCIYTDLANRTHNARLRLFFRGGEYGDEWVGSCHLIKLLEEGPRLEYKKSQRMTDQQIRAVMGKVTEDVVGRVS